MTEVAHLTSTRFMDVNIVVGTFGSDEWRNKGREAAMNAGATQLGPEQITVCHGRTLAEARNTGAKYSSSKWLIFLDADDGLAPGYIDAMLAGEGDIRKPATLGVYPDGTEDDYPVVIPERNIFDANHIVIGAMCRRDLFLEVGGFRELPILEDWDLWQRMVLAGAKIGTVPEAIYRVGVNPNSRNKNGRMHRQVYLDLMLAYRPEAISRGLY